MVFIQNGRHLSSCHCRQLISQVLVATLTSATRDFIAAAKPVKRTTTRPRDKLDARLRFEEFIYGSRANITKCANLPDRAVQRSLI